MKYLIDNNLPPKLAHALRELCSYDQSVEVFALSDKFKSSTKDIDWITELTKDSGWVVVSQDRFKKGDAEKEALRRSGLTVFFLAKQWSQEQYWSKAHNLVRWWPSIMEQAERMTGGSAFKVKWSHGSKAKFEQVKL